MSETTELSITDRLKKFFRMDQNSVKIQISSTGVPSVSTEEYLRHPQVQKTMESLRTFKVS